MKGLNGIFYLGIGLFLSINFYSFFSINTALNEIDDNLEKIEQYMQVIIDQKPENKLPLAS